MTILVGATPRVQHEPREAVWALARIEAGRMLRHPAPWLGAGLTCWAGYLAYQDHSLPTTQYEMAATVGPLLLGVSLASVSAFARELYSVSEDAPMSAESRSFARMLGGLALVALVAVVVATAATVLRLTGGVALGDEPGRTLNAHFTLPELVQPVLLAGLAVALGGAAGNRVKNRVGASILVSVVWVVSWAYWLFAFNPARWVSLIQVQPVFIEIPPDAGASTRPEDWLLARPNEFQDFWARLVVSPSLAAWHDVYLMGLTMLVVAVAVPGRWRRPLVLAGALVAVLAVLMQSTVTP
jgi:hypothetical protein